jgi:hypothetical protein
LFTIAAPSLELFFPAFLLSKLARKTTRRGKIAYLFSRIQGNFNMEPAIFNNQIAFIMTNSYYKETTRNPWAQKNIVEVKKGQDNYCEIEFPKRLKITMTPSNFSSNHPVVSWQPYPGASGYYVLVLFKDKYKEGDDNDGNDFIDVAFSKATSETNVKIFSHQLRFIPVFDSNGRRIEPTIQAGEVFRIEVYALDGSGKLDMGKRQGALFMDSLNVQR